MEVDTASAELRRALRRRRARAARRAEGGAAPRPRAARHAAAPTATGCARWDGACDELPGARSSCSASRSSRSRSPRSRLARRRPAPLRRALPGAADARERRRRAARAGAGVVPPALLCLALAGARARARAAGDDRRRAGRAGLGRARHRHVGLDERDRRRAVAARRRQGRAPSASSTDVPDELRVGLVAYSDAPHTVLRADRGPRRRSAPRSTRLAADGGTATGDALAGALQALGARGRRTARRPPWCCCPTAPRRRARPGRASPARPRPPACRSTPSRSGRRAARSRPNGRRALRAARPGGAARRSRGCRAARAFAAEDAGALDEVYERLGSQIGTREERREISAGFAAAGLLLLGGAMATSLRWRGRLP